MSDGNTATQVSPVTEEIDMNVVQKAFAFASNMIVRASELEPKVKELEAKIDGLTEDCNRVRRQNVDMDERLNYTREARDKAQGEANKLQQHVNDISQAHDKQRNDLFDANLRIASLEAQLAATRQERDDYGLKAMQNEDEAKRWKARAEAVKGKLDEVMSIFKADEAEAKPEAPAHPTPKPASPSSGESTVASSEASTKPTEPQTDKPDEPRASPVYGQNW